MKSGNIMIANKTEDANFFHKIFSQKHGQGCGKEKRLKDIESHLLKRKTNC